jgi:hypothetical protein
MFTYDPIATLRAVEAPVAALLAADDEQGGRAAALARASDARVGDGRGPIAVTAFPGIGHNLMRYRPEAVSATILSIARESALEGFEPS